jgi:hypothetical protein
MRWWKWRRIGGGGRAGGEQESELEAKVEEEET